MSLSGIFSRNNLYYIVKPFIPRSLQICIRRKIINRQRQIFKDSWPIDNHASTKPEGWKGWPDKKKFALILIHDVDTQKGHDKCSKIAEIEYPLGFHSTFFFVPERYKVSLKVIQELKEKGFGVGVHGLKHDGKLFKNKKMFSRRAKHINAILKKWDTVGFSSPSTHRNFEWMHELNIEYATTSFDTDPFEPQPEGVGTIFPFIVKNKYHQYVELPYTLAQDFSLFVLMREKNIDVWKKKLDWIAENGGMALINTHPDYMGFNGTVGNENYPYQYYVEFLTYLSNNYSGQYWHVLSKEMASFWKNHVGK